MMAILITSSNIALPRDVHILCIKTQKVPLPYGFSNVYLVLDVIR